MNLTVCHQYGFFGVLAAIIRESSDKQLVLRIVKVLPLIHQHDRVAPNTIDVLAADWLYQHIVFLHECCYDFSQGRKSLYSTLSLSDKIVFFVFLYFFYHVLIPLLFSVSFPFHLIHLGKFENLACK